MKVTSLSCPLSVHIQHLLPLKTSPVSPSQIKTSGPSTSQIQVRDNTMGDKIQNKTTNKRLPLHKILPLVSTSDATSQCLRPPKLHCRSLLAQGLRQTLWHHHHHRLCPGHPECGTLGLSVLYKSWRVLQRSWRRRRLFLWLPCGSKVVG